MSGATFHIVTLAFILLSSLLTFIALLFTSAPYGRYERKGWGPGIPARFAWIIMESPAVGLILVMFIFGQMKTAPYVVFIALWQAHYIYRTFLYPLSMRGANKNFPIALVLMAILFNSVNGYINGWELFFAASEKTTAWFYDSRFICGVALFLSGFLIHFSSDRILRNLREPEGTGYRMPSGGMYRLVSAPNYLGEILQWFGWALATWTLAGLAFALFTAANLIPRGISHHKWYKTTFREYPENRRAVIPFML